MPVDLVNWQRYIRQLIGHRELTPAKTAELQGIVDAKYGPGCCIMHPTATNIHHTPTCTVIPRMQNLASTGTSFVTANSPIRPPLPQLPSPDSHHPPPSDSCCNPSGSPQQNGTSTAHCGVANERVRYCCALNLKE